jgi:hypothetical protein
MTSVYLDWDTYFADGEAIGSVSLTAGSFEVDVDFSVPDAIDPGSRAGEAFLGLPFLEIDLDPGTPPTDPRLVGRLDFAPVQPNMRAEALVFDVYDIDNPVAAQPTQSELVSVRAWDLDGNLLAGPDISLTAFGSTVLTGPLDAAGTDNSDPFTASGVTVTVPGTVSRIEIELRASEVPTAPWGAGVFIGDLQFDLLCFAGGTRIATPSGPRVVETLRVGDLVDTIDRGPCPLVWVGVHDPSNFRTREAPAKPAVVIRADALGPGNPARDLVLSPQHRVLIGGKPIMRMFGVPEVLIAASRLVGRPGIAFMETHEGLRFYHLLLDHHALLRAEGAVAESLLPGPFALQSMSPDLRDQLVAAVGSTVEGSVPFKAARPIVRTAPSRVGFRPSRTKSCRASTEMARSA